MKKIISLMVIFAFALLFLPVNALAAEEQITVYVPNGTSLATQRILYNALAAQNIAAYIQEHRGGTNSYEAIIGRSGAAAAGVFADTQITQNANLTKIDIPLGTVQYVAYMRETEHISITSWNTIKGLNVGLPANSDYIMSHFSDYTTSLDMQSGFESLLRGRTDVYITEVYDDVTPSVPEGIVMAGVVDSAETYCWYNSSQTHIGSVLLQGLTTIKQNGIFERIKANKSVQVGNPKVVFLLSSYSEEMIWESQAQQALRETFSEYNEPVSLYVHNMNFRQTNYRAAQYETASNFISATFMDEFPDVIIAMDNDALAYLQENYTHMFNGVPVVFCGINGYNDSLISNFAPYATGISEFIDPTETVKFALSSNPNINRIYTIFDETSSASPVKDAIMQTIEQKYGNRMEITSSGNQSFEEIISEIQGFDSNTMVLMGTYFSDSDGRFMPENEVATRLCTAVNIPVYSLMSGYLGYGVVGGRVAYSKTFMQKAAQIAISIMQGEDVSSIPIIGDMESEAEFNTFIVDKVAADRFGIPANLYTNKGIVLNRDKSIFAEYPIQSTVAASVLIVLIVTAVLLMRLMHTKRLRDIALVCAENEKENNRLKSDFLARMSHEIRTPLNAIIGMDELILREQLSARLRKYATIILHSGKSLLSLINDILDFSKIEAGKMELVLSNYDVASLIFDVVSMIRVRVLEKPIEVKIDVSPDFPAYLYGDETRVRQILLNFLSNAAKYTNEGVITLKANFEFANSEKTEGTAIFTIIDTGIGIKEEDISKLFNAFSQVDTTTNRKVEGAGLGLAITKTLVDMMDGDVSLSSEYGKGSIFTVRISQQIQNYKPLENAWDAFNKRACEEEQTKNVRFIAPKAKILAVDDVETNQMVITGLLSPYKVKVDTVASGVDAIEAVMKTDYDFIFMDHMMPGMDGIQATAKIRAMPNERLKKIPIIALTANAISGMKEIFIENGFNDFISKPIESAELDKMMHKWIPKEKQQTATEKPKTEKAAGGLSAIEGIDLSNALMRFGGNTNIFEKILKQFVKSLDESIDDLSKLIKDGSDEQVQACLHAIKGMSGNVDCTELYKQSVQLEAAIKEDNHVYVNDNIPSFIKTARAIAGSITENLEI